jgi:hypothetical protein
MPQQRQDLICFAILFYLFILLLLFEIESTHFLLLLLLLLGHWIPTPCDAASSDFRVPRKGQKTHFLDRLPDQVMLDQTPAQRPDMKKLLSQINEIMASDPHPTTDLTPL